MLVEKSRLGTTGSGKWLWGFPFGGKPHHVKGQGGWLPTLPVGDHGVNSRNRSSLGVPGGLDPEGKAREIQGIKRTLDFSS